MNDTHRTNGKDEFWQGYMLLWKSGTDQDIKNGIDMLERAVALGHMEACKTLFYLYAGLPFNGRVIVARDLEKSIAYFRQAEALEATQQEEGDRQV